MSLMIKVTNFCSEAVELTIKYWREMPDRQKRLIGVNPDHPIDLENMKKKMLLRLDVVHPT